MSLKVKAVKGFSWTLFEGVFSQGALFIVGLILARLLTPDDYGVIGIVTAFIAISSTIVDGGFFTAILRKNDADDQDYNTMFYTNIGFSLLLYAILFFSSDAIAIFFKTPILSAVLKVAGLSLLFSGVSIIQRAILTKILDFKTLALIAAIASVISGSIAILLAYQGFGIWSLVVLSIARPFLSSLLMWFKTNWLPALIFSQESFRLLFGYGYKVLISKLISTLYNNGYSFIIGKVFSTAALGFYTRADQFQAPFSTNIATAINRISFPILAKFQDDHDVLLQNFVKFLRFAVFLNFTIMVCIAGMAKPIILLLIGEKWYTSIELLQLLCLTKVFYPLQILHLNLLLVKGYSNLNLKLEIIKKIILIPLIAFTVFYGIKVMLYGLIVFSILEYFINSYYTRKLVGYSLKAQFRDIRPFLLLAAAIGVPLFLISFLPLNLYLMMALQLVTVLVIFIGLNEVMQLKEYQEIKNKAFEFLSKRN